MVVTKAYSIQFTPFPACQLKVLGPILHCFFSLDYFLYSFKSFRKSRVQCLCKLFFFFALKSLWFFFLQFEVGESLSSGNLCQRSRPSSDLNNSTLQSPAHLKVQRSISANQKQRRFSDHGRGKSQISEATHGFFPNLCF